jgi:hypothetical protein
MEVAVIGLRVRIAVPLLATLMMALWSFAPTTAATAPSSQLDVILAKFNNGPPPAYRAFRRLEAGTRGTAKYGWLEVWTENRPGAGFSYTVIREGGYDYVRNKILHGVLKGEAELLAHGKPLRAALVPRNYEIEDGGVTDAGLMRLLLHPARKSEGIVRGSALVEPDGGSVVRIEGRLVKSPSFWVRDVDVTWKFTRFGDAVVPTELASSARVVFYGRQPFKMTYDYEMVEGRPVPGATRAALQDPR